MLSGAKTVGSTVLKYGLPALLAYSAGAYDGTLHGHRNGFDIGREHGQKEGKIEAKVDNEFATQAQLKEQRQQLMGEFEKNMKTAHELYQGARAEAAARTIQSGIRRHKLQTEYDALKNDIAARKIQYAYAKHKNNKLVKAYDTSQGLVQALSTHAMQQEERYKNLEEQYGDLHAMNLALRDAAASAPGPQRLHHKFRNALPF